MADVGHTLKDAAYIGIGIGVLAFQRAQVRRHEVTRQIEDVVNDFEGNVDRALDDLARLPDQARDVLVSARSAARDAATQLRARAA